MPSTFKQYNLKPFIMDALDELNFREPTAIQEKIIPEIRKGRSVVVNQPLVVVRLMRSCYQFLIN